MDTVLITDGNQRKALAAARALGAAGWRVLVAEETTCQMTRFSRYVSGALRSPPPPDTDRYAAWLVTTAREHGVDLVLPMDDGSTAAAVRVSDELGTRVLVPGRNQWEAARDKARTLALARSTGVPAPRGGPAPDLTIAAALAHAVGYPVVIRARRESGGRGLAFVPGPGELAPAYHRVRARDPVPLVQRQVPPGTLWDVCLLYDRAGTPRAAFVQRELRHFPLRGGTSTLQESAWRPDLIALAVRLLAPLGWCGPVEVEFLEEPSSGRVWLMEINPRFWASLALAVDCGLNFPLLAAALAKAPPTDQPCPSNKVPPPNEPRFPTEAPYPAGQRCRWLLPGDILHYLSNPERSRLEPGFWRTYDERTRDDVWSREDPGPTLGFVLAALRLAFLPSTWRLIFRW